MNESNKGLSLLSVQSSGKARHQCVCSSDYLISYVMLGQKCSASAVEEVIKEPCLICKGRSFSEEVMASAES